MKGLKHKLLGGIVAFITLGSIFLPITAAAATSNASNITRIYGNDRYETATKIAEAGWKGTSDYAVLASGMDSNLIDALTAGPLAAKLNAPILLTEEDSLNNFAQQELARLAVKTVYITITTGPNINLQNVIKQVKAIPTVTDVKILGGSDASQTSINIANELSRLGVKISKAIIVGGSGVDALSVSPIAGTQGIPILYSSGKSLSHCVSDYLNGLESVLRKTYVIGGTGVISDAAASQLPGTIDRVAGPNRYDTNIEVLKKFAGILSYRSTYLANGDTLVDALAVSPLAAQSGSPILLTSQSLPAASSAYAQANLSPNMVALGGESVVSSDDLAQLSSLQEFSKDSTSQGSTDPNNPSSINSALKITGNNITLSNITMNDSINLQGNNITLNNVSTTGTIFVDPGASGSAYLQNLTASTIVIQSGGFSIDLQNVTANKLIIEDTNNVYLISSGTTNINQTTSTSSANLENSEGGSFGQITIESPTQSKDQTPSMKFEGTFTQPITVNDSASLEAATSASIANVVIATDNSGQTVTLQGTYPNVTINTPSNVTLANNTTVQTLANNAYANITVPPSSSIINQISKTGVYYGADSGTSSNIYGNDFYIGQLGYGLNEHFNVATGGDDKNGSYFNGTGASNAAHVYGYWLLSGLSMAPNGTSATAWGQQQAQTAIKAFNEMSKYYGAKVKPVIFIDIEACGGGLDTQDYINNQAIYTAFVNEVKKDNSARPGTYSSPHEWNGLTMGANFAPLTPGYYWIADYPGGTPDQSILTPSNQFWVNFPQTDEQAQIWQFEGSPDYNVAKVLPN